MIKKIIPIALALSMLIPVGVSAAVLTASPAAASTTATEADSARAPFADQIKAVRTTIKANYNTNQAIRDEIKVKLAEVKTLIAQDKASKTLKAKKDALKTQRTVIKSNRTILKATNVTMTADRASIKTDKANKDYVALVSELQNIPSLQTSKIPTLQKINSKLDSIINLLKS
ncbi:MAG TPA: hypothetical protein VIK72_05500 [Clostridiaceae bacterium]